MYTFKITFQLYGGRQKCYTIKAGSRKAAIDKARDRARRANLDATGSIEVYRVGQIMEPLRCSISI